jgi:large subunit ribosomal protein L22
MTQVTAKLNHLHIAPRKVRLIADALKGLTVNQAEAQLLFRPQRSSEPLLKLLRSAVANAKNNHKMDPGKLVVQVIRVDQGPTMKRFLPRAMGRATPIHKKTSHVVLILEDKENMKAPKFNITVAKKTKLPKETKVKTKPKLELDKEQAKQQKPKERAGLLKRIFQRKSV